MKVKFTGVPGEKHESVFMYGQSFPLDEEVEVTNPTAIAKLRNHPHFESTPTDEDKKLDEQVRTEFAAAAQAGFMQAHTDAIRRQQGPAAAPAPTAPPPEPQMRPLRSALEYQQVVEGAAAGTDLTNVLRPEQQEQNAEGNPDTNPKEGDDGTADGQRTGGKDPAQAARPGSAGAGQAGRSGKGR